MWLLLLPTSIGMTLLTYLLAPVLVLFRTKDDYLPKWLSWFGTPDNPLLGDESYQTKPGRAPFTSITTGVKAYCNRVCWLWRNPAYGFHWNVLAFKVQPGYVTDVVLGTKPIEGSLKSDGFYLATLTNPDGSSCWQLYITNHWSETKCTKLNFGWKIWMAGEIKEGMTYSICAFTFNPVQWYKNI